MTAPEVAVTIEKIAYGGAGIGRLPEGRVCFVQGTLPGERALVCVVKSKKNHAEAEIVRLLEISPHRVAARCPVFGACGGCAYQHADYSLQLQIKTSQVADLLRRVGGVLNAEVQPMLPSPLQWGYRNRLAVHSEHGRVGFFHRKSHRLVHVTECPIASPEVNEQLARLAAAPQRSTPRITLREKPTKHGFTQVNAGAAELLAHVVTEMSGSGALLIDAYCGAGFFSKKLRPGFSQTLGIEWSEGAVRYARQEAAENETYLEGAVEVHLEQVLSTAPLGQTVLLVDPPAEGLSPDTVRVVLAHPPARIVYVSCDPATFARDAKRLSEAYDIKRLQPVDMFPQTAEIELAAELHLKPACC